MTTKYERTRAVNEMAKSVRLLWPYLRDGDGMTRVPRPLLRQITGWLRHYPTESEITLTASYCPDWWAPSEESK